MSPQSIGFIGQGWIGKHYADDFEARGLHVVRYSLEPQYAGNKDAVKNCDIVFIAVPTPTTPDGFNVNSVRDVLSLVGEGKIAVIKSTLLPGTTNSLQEEFPHIFVLHSPEFLVEATAAYNAAHPDRNIIGIPENTEMYKEKADAVLAVLPPAPFVTVISAKDAEFVKYAGNCFLYTKVLFMNILYDLVATTGGDWAHVKEAFINDPRIGASHTEPVHKTGRGAGGHCFIKDFEAFRELYDATLEDERGSQLLEAMAHKNFELLKNSGKDLDLLEGVYGDLEKFTGR